MERDTLKSYFAQGAFPTAAQFAELIDKAIIQGDDDSTVDSSGTASINWENRGTYDAEGNYSIDWGDRTLGSQGSVALDWNQRQLYGAENQVSIDWNARLLRNTAGTPVLTWNGSGVGIPNGTHISFADAQIATDTAAASITKRASGGNVITNTASGDALGTPDKWLFLKTETKTYKIPLYAN